MTTASRWTLRSIALVYIFAILALPVGLIFYRAFEPGLASFFDTITQPDAVHALWITLLMVAIAVPINTIFGVITAIVLVRQKFRGQALLNVLVDLPFAVSPVVIGLALILVYGTGGWFGADLAAVGIQVIFSLPGMILATIFVSLPFVVREVVPVLREVGTEQEQAAQTLGANGWQTFWRITLPSIRWGLTYGIVLATARALGEFGAVAVVSGSIQGQTQTATLYVWELFQTFDKAGAYAIAVVLAVMALMVLLSMNFFNRKQRREA